MMVSLFLNMIIIDVAKRRRFILVKKYKINIHDILAILAHLEILKEDFILHRLISHLLVKILREITAVHIGLKYHLPTLIQRMR